MAEECGDVAKHVRHFTRELRKPGIASGLLRKSFQLICRLQVIHARHVAHSTVRVGVILKGPAQTNAKNRDVTLAKLFHGLIESVFGEGVHAASEHDDGLLALYIHQAIHGFKDGIEQVRFAEAREVETIETLHVSILVLGEAPFDTGLHVKGFPARPIFFFFLLRKRRGATYYIYTYILR